MKKLLIITLALICLTSLAAQAKKQPYRALLYSAVCPGGGQIYNQQYLKAGLVLGVQSYLVYSAIANAGKRRDFRDLAAHAPNEQQQLSYNAQSRDYKERMTNDVWWIGITAALSLIDAFVDAHLYDFESEKEKVHLRFGDSSLQLQYQF